jgi:hypothetical protein
VTREELEHAIRAACDVAEDDEVYVFGSQAILGQYPDAPVALRQSAEADIAPVHAIDKIDLIDGSLGELSSFHLAHGFYVHGVGLEAAVLPTGWQRRAIRVQNENTNDATGWCVEAHDLAVSKLVAWREKDRDFVRVLLTEELVIARRLLLRIGQLANDSRVPEQRRATMRAWVRGILKDLGRGS